MNKYYHPIIILLARISVWYRSYTFSPLFTVNSTHTHIYIYCICIPSLSLYVHNIYIYIYTPFIYIYIYIALWKDWFVSIYEMIATTTVLTSLAISTNPSLQTILSGTYPIYVVTGTSTVAWGTASHTEVTFGAICYIFWISTSLAQQK